MAEAMAPEAMSASLVPHALVAPGQHRDAASPSTLRRAVPTLGLTGRIHPVLGDLLAACTALAFLGLFGAPVGLRQATVLLLVWPLVLAAHGAYAREVPLAETWAGTRRVLHSGMALALVCWVGSTLAGAAASASLIAFTGCVTGAGVALRVLPRAARRVGNAPAATLRAVLVGHPVDVQGALAELGRPGRQPIQVVAACLSQPGPVEGLPASACGGVDTAAELATEHAADAVLVLPGNSFDPPSVRRLQWRLEAAGIEMYVGTGLLDVAPFRRSHAVASGLALLHVSHPPLRGFRRVVKELLERGAAAFVLVLLAPVLVAVGLLVRHDSPGGAIFRQERVGLRGKTFTMLKFRTMSAAAESLLVELAEVNETGGVLFKLRQDPRVTEFGRVLRRYSIDEAPQLWNVVRGDMALVGPRPALPSEVAQYDVDPHRRLAVKPGLTGLWQVSGRSDLSWEDTVRLDNRYVDNWSLGLDLAIVVRTVRAVLDHRGAY